MPAEERAAQAYGGGGQRVVEIVERVGYCGAALGLKGFRADLKIQSRARDEPDRLERSSGRASAHTEAEGSENSL